MPPPPTPHPPAKTQAPHLDAGAGQRLLQPRLARAGRHFRSDSQSPADSAEHARVSYAPCGSCPTAACVLASHPSTRRRVDRARHWPFLQTSQKCIGRGIGLFRRKARKCSRNLARVSCAPNLACPTIKSSKAGNFTLHTPAL